MTRDENGKDQPNGQLLRQGSDGSKSETSDEALNGGAGRIASWSGQKARLDSVRRTPNCTEDEQLLNRSLPAEPMPQAAELGAFTHTDSWRVLRIQGEFVHGINALAEVVLRWPFLALLESRSRIGSTQQPASSVSSWPMPALP